MTHPHPTPPPHPGAAAPSRERVSSEETSTCQEKSTSSPSCLPSPPHPCVPLPPWHPSPPPITPPHSCHLIQISELDSVFVCASILPVRRTEGDGLTSRPACLWGGAKAGGERKVFLSSEMSNSSGVKRLLSIRRA